MTKWWVPIALAMSLAAAPAMACQTFPQDLGEPYQEEALLNGLFLVLFQIVGTSGDGTVTKTLPNPLFYWIDTGNSGRYNKTWIDPVGKGLCQDIVPYWSLPNEVGKDVLKLRD